ncbi:MAG: alanyl-tRNA synthetase [Bacteroidales bacterium]|nr:alanyl-tRNA synthetase [Bacteroidales bacterium]
MQLPWVKKYGIAGLIFFIVKGIVTLAIGYFIIR